MLAASGVTFSIVNQPLVFKKGRSDSLSSNSISVYTEAVKAIRQLASEIPKAYHQDLAEATSRMGYSLFSQKAYSSGKRAYELARTLGVPTYRRHPKAFRWAARIFGPENAEILRRYWRVAVPPEIRAFLRKPFL